MKEQVNKYNWEELKLFVVNVLTNLGFSNEDANLASDVLISADLRGIDSHGVARLIGYKRLLDKKRANPKPNIKIEHETPSTATIDGDKSLGLVSAPYAMDIAIEKAKNVGSGWVAVNNSNHFGIAAYHAMKGLDKDMIGIAMTNASPIVSPTYSKDRLLGTNPICVAFPAKKEPALVIDMATTTASNGKLEILQRKNENAPTGWIQDANGNSSVNPSEVQAGGAILPLGSDPEHSSYKGYCLGAMVDVFTAVLSGANYGPWVPPFVAYLNPLDNLVGKGIGHFVGAMRIDAFRPAEEFKAHMDNWIKTFRSAKPINEKNKVIIPGDPERESEKVRKENGIPLLQKVEDSLAEIAQSLNLEMIRRIR